MKWFTAQIATGLARYSALNGEEQPPIPLAGLAGLAFFALTYLIERPAAIFLKVWWVGLLLYTVIPLLVTFAVLHQSCWRQEWGATRRIWSLLMISCLILVSSILLMGVLFLTGIIFVLGIKHDTGPG